MKTKVRLWVTIAALVLAAVASVVAVVAVFAARNATLQSTLNITYQPVEIVGSVKLERQTENGSKTEVGTTNFNGSEAEGATVTGQSLTLAMSEDNSHYVDLIFTFTNKSQAKQMKATISGLPTLTNATIKTTDGTEVTTSSNNTLTIGKATSATTFGTGSFTIRIQVTTTTSVASAVGNINWLLESIN